MPRDMWFRGPGSYTDSVTEEVYAQGESVRGVSDEVAARAFASGKALYAGFDTSNVGALAGVTSIVFEDGEVTGLTSLEVDTITGLTSLEVDTITGVSSLEVDTITGVSSLEVDTITGVSSVEADALEVGSINGGALAGERNVLLNGDFSIWQRGASDRPDMWKVSATGGVAHAFSRQSFAPGAPLGAGNGEPEYFMRWALTGTTVAGSSAIGAAIENVRTFAGEEVTLSFWAKASTALNMRSYLAQRFGSGGSSTVWTPSATFALTTSWQKFTRTVSLASISGKTIGAGNHLQVYFDCYSALTDPSIDIARIQIELGSAATPFERRPYALELAACQRYFEVLGGAPYYVFTVGNALSASTVGGPLAFVEKRATPTLAASGNFVLYTGSTTIAIASGSVSLDQATAARGRLVFSAGGAASAGTFYNFAANNDATAKITLSAEF